MTQYVDTSALLKRYIDEPDSDRANELLSSDEELVTGRHTIVEVRRNLARLLDAVKVTTARRDFASDLASFSIIELEADACEPAASIAEQTGIRSLDALHLGAARRLGTAVPFVTFDIQQADAARRLGFNVLGV